MLLYSSVRHICLACIYAYRVLLPPPLLLLLLLCVLVAMLQLLLQLQLLAPAVRHRVPDGKFCCWLFESDSAVFRPFSSFNHDSF